MPDWWSWTAVAVGLLVLVALIPVFWLFIRRRWLAGRGRVFECSLKRPGAGWTLGVAESLTGGPNPLTDREIEVLRAALAGASATKIAAGLHLSHGTVRNHLSSAIGKTGARNRAEAAQIAQSNGWL